MNLICCTFHSIQQWSNRIGLTYLHYIILHGRSSIKIQHIIVMRNSILHSTVLCAVFGNTNDRVIYFGHSKYRECRWQNNHIKHLCLVFKCWKLHDQNIWCRLWWAYTMDGLAATSSSKTKFWDNWQGKTVKVITITMN